MDFCGPFLRIYTFSHIYKITYQLAACYMTKKLMRDSHESFEIVKRLFEQLETMAIGDTNICERLCSTDPIETNET